MKLNLETETWNWNFCLGYDTVSCFFETFPGWLAVCLENTILMKTQSSIWTWTLDLDLGFVKSGNWEPILWLWKTPTQRVQHWYKLCFQNYADSSSYFQLCIWFTWFFLEFLKSKIQAAYQDWKGNGSKQAVHQDGGHSCRKWDESLKAADAPEDDQ